MPSGSEEEECDQGAARSERAESSAGNGGRGGGERKSGGVDDAAASRRAVRFSGVFFNEEPLLFLSFCQLLFLNLFESQFCACSRVLKMMTFLSGYFSINE